MYLLAATTWKKAFFHWMIRLGGPGLIVVGLLDNSVVPLPGSMDVITIILASSRKDLWWYYAIMATVGSVIGGYLTYRIGEKGGKEALETRISKRRADKVYHIFERYGFWSVAVGAICPPPVPIVPFLIAPGALHYPRGKFLVALSLGRAVRYTLVAYFGSLYGHALIRGIFRYYRPLMYILLTLAVAGGAVAFYYWRRYRAQHPRGGQGQSSTGPQNPVRKAA